MEISLLKDEETSHKDNRAISLLRSLETSHRDSRFLVALLMDRTTQELGRTMDRISLSLVKGNQPPTLIARMAFMVSKGVLLLIHRRGQARDIIEDSSAALRPMNIVSNNMSRSSDGPVDAHFEILQDSTSILVMLKARVYASVLSVSSYLL
uniref:Anthocyanidin 3-O-glucosyltransferase n=1 Tax=Anthurium amnicola TaxID=1678845 RepID=A0A1D1XF70_9ARAE